LKILLDLEVGAGEPADPLLFVIHALRYVAICRS
jgi:hypothetical protein